MGLDTFAVMRGEDGEWHVAPDEPFEGLRLRDGWGSSSIRGKVPVRVGPRGAGPTPHPGGPSVDAGASRPRGASGPSKGVATMGLDTFASSVEGERKLTEEDERAFEGVELCGGMFSGNGGSFRGKVYSDVVRNVTGVGLYEFWIPPETVREMADAFDRCDAEQVAEESEEWGYGTVTANEVGNLRRFFRICADRGLGLIGWW